MGTVKPINNNIEKQKKNMILSFITVLCLTSVLQVCLAKGRDFYKILGIQRDATDRQIKKAYRTLSKKWHPDKNSSPEAKTKFADISAAYEALSDEEKRRIYDQEGEEGLSQEAQGRGGHDPFDIFSSLFGGGGGGGGRGGRNQKQQFPALHIELPITLKDIYNGRTFRIMNKKTILCQKCRGTGSDNPDDVKKCTKCRGTGVVTTTRQIGPGFVQQMQSECPVCKGKGKIIKTKCAKCHGSKVEHGHEEELTVVVEQGMPDGEEIILEQEGDEHPDYTSSDIVVHLQTIFDPRLQRDGNDLTAILTIPLNQALLGVDTTFVHLDGREIPIKRDGVTHPGLIMSVANEGMPVHNFPSERGTLYIQFEVEFPEELSDDQKKLIDQAFPKK